jgi:hypothetical protein
MTKVDKIIEDPMTYRAHSTDCPHTAAVNDRPWRSFPDYAQARAWVDRQVKRPTDTAWIRCSIHDDTSPTTETDAR